MTYRHVTKMLYFCLILILAAGLALSGCSGARSSFKKWAGLGTGEEDEEPKAPPEAVKEEVVIDGKTWVRSRNPYYLTYPDQPEYIYAEKGTEFVGLTGLISKAIAKKVGEERAKVKGVPEDKVQELVRKEMDRILREQGIGALYSREKGGLSPVVGRYVAVFPNPESPPGQQGQNRALAAAAADAISRSKDLKVAGPDKVKAALSTAKVAGKLKLRQNIQALGDAMGVHALILTDVVPPSGKAPGFLVMEVYDTFLGTKVDGIAAPVEGSPRPDDLGKFSREHTLRVSAALMNVDWFGRVEFIKEGKVYLSLGQNAGLKAGDRLKVVTPGKEVVNPTTHASLGFTGDETQGELKVTELLGNTGAVAQVMSGGPFKANDKVKAAR